MQKETNLTAGQWCDRWFCENQDRWSGSTVGGYRNLIYRHILPGIGSIPLVEVTEDTVTSFYDSLRSQGLSSRSVWCVHLLLRRCMDEAARDRRIPYNPVRLCQEPQAEAYQTTPLCLGQLQRYLNAAEQLGALPLIYTGLSSGLRQCELITLSWADFHVRCRYILKGQQSGTSPGTDTRNQPLCVPQPQDRSAVSAPRVLLPAQADTQAGGPAVGGLPEPAASMHGGGDMTLKDYILRWQEVYDKNQSRPATYAVHGYIFKNHILPGLGEIQLSGLTVEQVGDFLEERRRFGGHRPESPEYPGLGEHTMRHIHRLLQQCLNQAIRDGLITENPARAFHYPKPRQVSANVLTPAEVENYLDAAERLGHLPMFLLALTAGLRQGELIALKWSDLDVKKGTLIITEKRSVERRELVEYEGSTRIVSLTPETVELLRLEHAKHPGSPLMFMHPATQRPYSPQMVRRLHNEIIQEARLDHIRFADLRHTCAVLSLQNGMDTKEVSQMLGHFRIAMTRQNYAPYLSHTAAKSENRPNEASAEELRQAANVLDHLLNF